MWRVVLTIIVFGLAMAVSGCSDVFTRIDFKYTSIAHLKYKDAMTTLDTDPETLVFDLSEAFRRQGGTVLQRNELSYYLEESADAQACWEANSLIFNQEFDAYRRNNYSQYSKIDRVTPYTSRGITNACRIFHEVPAEPKQSWLLMVQFPPRSANTTIYRPTNSSFFVFSGIDKPPIQGFGTSQVRENVGIEIATRLYIWAWRGADGRTVVYLEGRPFSGQVEAANGNSIGWSWWKVSNGYDEAEVVRSYVLLLQDYYRERRRE